MSNSAKLRAVLERTEDLTPGVRAFRFRVEGRSRFEFRPGQWVRLHVPHQGKLPGRGYSIASPPGGDNRFDLCVKHVGAGPGSDRLRSLRRGDRVEIDGPHGTFTLREPLERAAVFVANGTGVTPFRAMLGRALGLSSGHPLTLVLGARTRGDLLYHREWEEQERRHANFRYLPVLSRPEEGWEGPRGYVQDATPDLLEPLRDAEVYVCGLGPMVSAVREQCRAWGYPRERVHFETYE